MDIMFVVVFGTKIDILILLECIIIVIFINYVCLIINFILHFKEIKNKLFLINAKFDKIS